MHFLVPWMILLLWKEAKQHILRGTEHQNRFWPWLSIWSPSNLNTTLQCSKMLVAGCCEISSVHTVHEKTAHLVSCCLSDTSSLYQGQEQGYSGILPSWTLQERNSRLKPPLSTLLSVSDALASQSPAKLHCTWLIKPAYSCEVLHNLSSHWSQETECCLSFRSSPTYLRSRAKNNFYIQKTAKSKRNKGVSLKQKLGTALATGPEIVLTLKSKHLQRQFRTFKNTQHMV